MKAAISDVNAEQLPQTRVLPLLEQFPQNLPGSPGEASPGSVPAGVLA